MDGGDFAVGQGACEAAVPVDSLLELKPNSSVWGVVVSSRKELQSHETCIPSCFIHLEDGCGSVRCNVATV